MRGLMMDRPLLVSGILRHAARNHADTPIVSILCDGSTHAYDYARFERRVAALAHVLVELGVKTGDRVATIAVNTHRHLELYYAIASIGAVCHTINPRLGPKQMGYVINDAEDSVVFFDVPFTELVAGVVAPQPSVKHLVALAAPEQTPVLPGRDVLSYEALLDGKPTTYDWPEFDENTAAGLCYTSGTTGAPKGVLYSHRSLVLHGMIGALADGAATSSRDVILPMVPMFHVNAWGLPHAAAMVGAGIVLPGPVTDGATMQKLVLGYGVTMMGGVPSLWMALLDHLKKHGGGLGKLNRVIVGGAAVPRFMVEAFERDHGVALIHAWGMTEMSPIGTVNMPKGKHVGPLGENIDRKMSQGRVQPLVEMRITDPAGKELPWDGESSGHLQVRGPTILGSYYKGAGSEAFTVDGWFDTGDVAAIDPDGYLFITDRSKDAIKSGGEWISSITIEDAAMTYPDVAMAAAIGMPHSRWQERPLLVAVPKPDVALDKEALMAYMQERLDRIAWPDAIEVVESIPLGATGKMLKTALRQQFAGYVLPTDTAVTDTEATG